MFSHLCPFQLNGNPHLLGYGDNDGSVTILEIGPDGLGPDGAERPPKSYTRWDTGYTSFVSFEWNGKPYIWAYRSTSSDVVVLEIGAEGVFKQVNPSFKWDTGYTKFVSWSVAPDQVYIWGYRASSSDVVILKIDPSGNNGWFDQRLQKKWDTGYTSFVSVEWKGKHYIWAYRSTSSDVVVFEIAKDGTSLSQVSPAFKWDTGYTSFVSWSVAPDQVYIWGYRASSSDVVILKIDPSGNNGWFDQRLQQKWDTGYTQFGYVGVIENDPYVFAYRASDSNLCLNTISRDGTGFSNNYLRKLYDAEVAVAVNPAEIFTKSFDGWGCSLCWWANAFGNGKNNGLLADMFFTTKPSDYTWKDVDEKSLTITLPGLGMNIARYNIGGYGGGQKDEVVNTKYVPAYKLIRGYWPAPGVEDWEVDSSQRYMLELARQRDVNIVEFFSNSPMWWMCTKDSSQGGEPLVNGIEFNKNYDLFAKYLAAVVKYAIEHWGVDVTYIEPFNEPASLAWVFSIFVHQEGCNIDSYVQALVLSRLDSWLKSDGIHVAITASDENKVPQARETLKAFARYESNPIALVAKVNVHGYDGLEPYRGPDRALLRAEVRSLKKKLWMSEYGDDDQTGMKMATSIMLDLTELQPDAWIYWQALDGGGWGLIDADCNKQKSYLVSRKYYVFAQFSRHLRQGCYLIGSTDPNTVAAYDADAQRLHIVTLADASGKWIHYDLSAFSSVKGPVRRWDTTTNPTDGVPDRTYACADHIALNNKTLWSYCYTQSVYSFDIDGVVI